MTGKQTMFFVTISDIKPILENIEASFAIHYFQMGLFDAPETVHYNSIFENSTLGFIDKGDWNYDKRFLVMPKELPLKIRDVPQRKGGIKYAIDPAINPVGICLQIGGVYTGKENVLVAGKISTAKEDSFSINLYNSFSKRIKKTFKKIEDFYVGKEAVEKLRYGWRLVLDEGRRKEFDLSLS